MGMMKQGSTKRVAGSLHTMFASIIIPYHQDALKMTEAYL